MSETHEITEYEYYVWGSRSAALVQANVVMYGASGYLGALWFYDDAAELAEPVRHSPGVFSLRYRMRDFPHIVDMLRNEKPVYLHWDDSFATNTRISTTKEPVGEGGA